MRACAGAAPRSRVTRAHVPIGRQKSRFKGAVVCMHPEGQQLELHALEKQSSLPASTWLQSPATGN